MCLLRGRIEFLDIFHVDFRPQGRCAMAQVISCRPRNAKARVRLQVSPRKICFGQSDTKRGSAPSTSVSPDSIIPPMPHTHSFIYHRLCILFFSQYFSFPCQFHSTNAPYSFIHLPPTLYTVFLPVLQFPLSVSFYQRPTLIHSSTTDAL